MPDKIGPLLRRAMNKLKHAAHETEIVAITSMLGRESPSGELPIVVKVPTLEPEPDESWAGYRDRAEDYLLPVRDLLVQTMGLTVQPLIAANAFQTSATAAQVDLLGRLEQVDRLELDPWVRVVSLDDAADDLLLANFRTKHPTLDGSGVKVAVLDSGIDTQHPFIAVAQSVSTSGEEVELPGHHGTHCAGIIASRDLIFGGVAPEVELLNIKVLRADGVGKHTTITKGIDEALDAGAHVISMSLGFNHLPPWSDRGHGWLCTDGHCPLCTAVDNAVTLNNALVVVAAGNDHERAEALRIGGFGDKFDTELSCPGQSRKGVTVGALTKNTFQLAHFSSRGPTAFGDPKPVLCAPGVNIMSTIPAPRTAAGVVVNNPPRSSLFGRDSGTSMATPFVSGAAALLIQEKIDAGVAFTPDLIISELIERGLVALVGSANEVGNGRLSLGNI